MELYNYQKDYLASLPRNVLMYAGLGTGKTAMSLMHWKRQNPLLIVAPAAKLRTGDWQEEAEAWLGKETANRIIYISYEKLRLNDSKTHRPNWWQFVARRNGGRVYDVIADEAHFIKNPQAKQSKAIKEIVDGGGQFIGLTATPMPNSWIDFAGYSKLWGFTSGITEFKRTYVDEQRFKGYPEIVGYRNVPTLERQFKSIAPHLSREQASELPDRHFIRTDVKMSDADYKKYATVKLTRMYHGEMLDNPSKALHVLRQLTTKARLPHLQAIAEATSENIVVFYNYISEREAILKELHKLKNKTILRYDGDKHDELPASNAELSDVILVAHYKSASTGLNLQWASVTVYFSPTYSYLDFEQSAGRTHRTGQKKKCLYYLFSVKGSVDPAVYRTLRDKESFTERLAENYLNDN